VTASGHTRKLVALLLVMSMLVTGLGISPLHASAAQHPFFVKNGPKNAIFGQMANQPQAVRYGRYTFVAYQGPALDPYVAAWNHEANRWIGPYRAGVNPFKKDSHGAPAIHVDGEGYVHVYYGAYHTPLLHVRSTETLSIDSWVKLPSMGTQVTYPQVVHDADGGAELFYRERTDLGMRWMLRSLEPTGTAPVPLTVLQSQNSFDAYPSARTGADGTLHIAWVAVDWQAYFSGTSWARRNLYYLQRDPEGVWRNAAGAEVALPVNRTSAQQFCLVYDSEIEDPAINTNLPVPGADASGAPCVLFNVGSGSGPESYRYRFARYTEGAWELTDVSPTDHFFDSGTWRLEADGTLTAFVETGGSKSTGLGDRTYEDVGGHIYRFTSPDGSEWTKAERIDPAEQGVLYHNVHAVADGNADDQVLFMEWSDGPSIEAHGLFLWGESGLLGRDFTVEQRRLAGQTRYDTAARIAKAGFPQGTSTVVIASGEGYADAMVAAPLANALGAPILLVSKNAIPVATGQAIRDLGATSAVVVGGPFTITDATVAALSGYRITSTERIWGRSRYDVAIAVADRLETVRGKPQAAYIASGEVYPDGLAVGAVAAWRGVPVLLTRRDRVPGETTAKIASLDISDISVVGGPATISEETFAKLGAKRRISGANRYEVAANIANHGLALGMLPRNIIVATGRDYPDSLTSSVLAARLRAPVILTPPDRLTDAGAAHLSKHKTKRLDVIVCGGTISVSEAAYAQIWNAVKP